MTSPHAPVLLAEVLEALNPQPGDVIVGVNNQPITSIEQFRKLLDAAGNRFALLIQRGGSRIFLPVRIG